MISLRKAIFLNVYECSSFSGNLFSRFPEHPCMYAYGIIEAVFDTSIVTAFIRTEDCIESKQFIRRLKIDPFHDYYYKHAIIDVPFKTCASHVIESFPDANIYRTKITTEIVEKFPKLKIDIEKVENVLAGNVPWWDEF